MGNRPTLAWDCKPLCPLKYFFCLHSASSYQHSGSQETFCSSRQPTHSPNSLASWNWWQVIQNTYVLSVMCYMWRSLYTCTVLLTIVYITFWHYPIALKPKTSIKLINFFQFCSLATHNANMLCLLLLRVGIIEHHKDPLRMSRLTWGTKNFLWPTVLIIRRRVDSKKIYLRGHRGLQSHTKVGQLPESPSFC